MHDINVVSRKRKRPAIVSHEVIDLTGDADCVVATLTPSHAITPSSILHTSIPTHVVNDMTLHSTEQPHTSTMNPVRKKYVVAPINRSSRQAEERHENGSRMPHNFSTNTNTVEEGGVDKECIDCYHDFHIPIKEVKFFKSKKFVLPSRCQDCRAARKLTFTSGRNTTTDERLKQHQHAIDPYLPEKSAERIVTYVVGSHGKKSSLAKTITHPPNHQGAGVIATSDLPQHIVSASATPNNGRGSYNNRTNHIPANVESSTTIDTVIATSCDVNINSHTAPPSRKIEVHPVTDHLSIHQLRKYFSKYGIASATIDPSVNIGVIMFHHGGAAQAVVSQEYHCIEVCDCVYVHVYIHTYCVNSTLFLIGIELQGCISPGEKKTKEKEKVTDHGLFTNHNTTCYCSNGI